MKAPDLPDGPPLTRAEVRALGRVDLSPRLLAGLMTTRDAARVGLDEILEARRDLHPKRTRRGPKSPSWDEFPEHPVTRVMTQAEMDTAICLAMERRDLDWSELNEFGLTPSDDLRARFEGDQ